MPINYFINKKVASHLHLNLSRYELVKFILLRVMKAPY